MVKTRITVTPADEDEVILAGMPDEPTSGAELPAEWEGGSAESAGSSALEQASASAAEVLPEAVEAAAPQKIASSAKRAKATSRDEYKETTLDDLESSPMPLVQRIVIVAAVVCIIGALVYYFVVMR